MDKYKKIRQIGEGSFGVAHLARVKQSGKYVVIKEVNLVKLSKSDQEVSRKEVVVLSQLKHCNIVTYLDSFESRSMLSLVMDYCDGGDLSERIKAQNGNLFKEEQILNWFVQLCLAVKYIHDKNILHRDIKTQNLFLTKHGLLKLGDFGIAKVLGSTGDLARTCIGTPYYLSPEICWGKLYDNKSDIWSMGCVLYELSALKHAFEATNMQELISKIMSAIYPEISLMYSNDLKNIIDSMLKRNPSYRPSCDILLKKPILQNRLKHLLSGLGLVFDPSPLGPAIQKKHPVRPGDESIAIAGIPFQSAQDDARVSKAVKRPMSCDANNARIKHDIITRLGKENIASNYNYNNYNYNRNKYHKPRTPMSRAFVNVSRKDSTLKLKGIGIASRASPKMDIIKSNDSRSRTPSIPPSHRRKQDHRHIPLPQNNRPLYAEQPHNLSPRLPTKPRGGNDAIRHGANHVSNNKINNVYNIDSRNVVYNVNNNDDNDCIKKYINTNANSNNANNKIAINNDSIPRQMPKVPPLRLPRDPLFSDHEPSPARQRDEERKRQDMEYLKRFREIRLDNLREKFHKKMELLEAMNPITGLPQAPDQSDIDQRRRKLSLIKAQVDARVERIKKELEMKRQEEYVRESIRISKERMIPDLSDDGDGNKQNSVMTPPKDQSQSSANRKRDQVVTPPAANDVEEEVYPIKHDDIIDIKRSTILKKINDQLSSNKRPDSNIIRQPGWKEIGHCNDLRQLDLEESHPINAIDREIKSGQPISERRHWLPTTDTIIKNLGNESMETTASSQSSDSTCNSKMTLTESNDLMSTNDDLKDMLIGDYVNDDDYNVNDNVKIIDGKTNANDVINIEDGCDDDTNNDETSRDDVNKINHDNASRDAKESDISSNRILETTTNHASEFQNTASSSSSSSTLKKFLSNLKLFISKLVELKPKKRRSSESDIGVGKHGLVRSSRSLDSNLLSYDSHHVSDFRPSAEKVKSLIRREAFSNEESSKVNLTEHVADRETEGKIYKQDCSEHVKVLESADDVRSNEGANLNKCSLSSDVDGLDYEERMKRKRMIILQIINKSFEVTQSLSAREKEIDNTHHRDLDNDVDKDVVYKDGDDNDDGSDGGNGDEKDESTDNQKILDEDPEDDGEVMMESMANLLVTNPEDITGDFTSRSLSKKKQRGRLATYRIIIRKPLVRMRRRKKRIVLSSWSSTSLEDLQTMKSLLESYQNEDHN